MIGLTGAKMLIHLMSSRKRNPVVKRLLDHVTPPRLVANLPLSVARILLVVLLEGAVEVALDLCHVTRVRLALLHDSEVLGSHRRSWNEQCTEGVNCEEFHSENSTRECAGG